jgi:hypothetical protein
MSSVLHNANESVINKKQPKTTAKSTLRCLQNHQEVFGRREINSNFKISDQKHSVSGGLI